MKKMCLKGILYVCISALALLTINSCVQETEKNPANQTAKLSLSLGLDIKVEDARISVAKEDYKITIYNAADNQVVKQYDKYSEVPATIELPVGTYYATATSNNDHAAAFENPVYSGTSSQVTIAQGDAKTISITCSLANTKVTVVYSDITQREFSDYYTVIKNANGDSLVFSKTEKKAAYFASNTNLTLTAYLTHSGGIKTLTDTINSINASKHYAFTINEAVGSDQQGRHYYIPDKSLRIYLKRRYPDTMEGNSLILEKADMITSIYSDDAFTSLDGIQYMSNLKEIRCADFSILPDSIPNSLQKLTIGYSFELSSVSLPSLASLTSLQSLSLGYLYFSSPLPDLPSGLTNLNLSDCSNLTSLPALPSGLTNLNLTHCSDLTSLPALPSGLTNLNLTVCSDLTSLPALPSGLTYLELIDCTSLTSLPALPSGLTYLDLSACTSLTSLPALPSSLTSLDLYYCSSLTSLPALPTYLPTLNIEGASKLSCVTNKPIQFAELLKSYPLCQ